MTSAHGTVEQPWIVGISLIASGAHHGGMMRAAAGPEARDASWAYDCALAESRSRWEARWRAESIVASHPGFAKLQTLPGNCVAD